MPITAEELARRLKAARQNCNLTQEHVADALNLSRTAIVQIEQGQRAVSSLELDRLARLYGRNFQEFVDDREFVEDPLVALFRVTSDLKDHPELGSELRRCANLCREATQLEELLDLANTRPPAILYDLGEPKTKWEAIRQGQIIADQERQRIDLGNAPIREVGEIIRQLGVRVCQYVMPDSISGLFFHSRDIGLVIVVNGNQSTNRQRFSYAHEYCHLLVDRKRAAFVSRAENRQELLEVRANAFAANFLLPEGGVRSFFPAKGKGDTSRHSQQAYDDVQPVNVKKRHVPKSQDIQAYDVIALGHHFGTSYETTLYRLLNLNLLTVPEHASLQNQKDIAGLIQRLQFPDSDNREHGTLRHHLLNLGLEALRRGKISRGKLVELAEELAYDRAEIEQLLTGYCSVNVGNESVYPEPG